MSYMLLIVEPVGQRRARTEAEGREMYDRMLHFSADLKERGLLTLSQSLKTDAKATRVYREGQESVIVDGPFAEAKEIIAAMLGSDEFFSQT